MTASFDQKTYQIKKADSKFQARFNSFSILTWLGKPRSICPRTCAEHGWISGGVDTLKCLECKSILDASHIRNPLDDVSDFERALRENHKEGCFWKGFHPLAPRFQPLTKKVIQERMRAWDNIDDINFPNVHLLNFNLYVESFFPSEQVSTRKRNILALCLLNWTPLEKDVSICEECGRQYSFIYSSSKSDFDVVMEHRYFCRVRSSKEWLSLAKQ